MKTFNNNQFPVNGSDNNRRAFLKNGIALGLVATIPSIGLITSCKEEGEEEVSPAEDLMREHGVLNRILLIYDTCKLHLVNNEQFDLAVLNNSAQIIRIFIEDYHEKLEEDYLFPRFEKANLLTDLVQVLRSQHNAGRILTDQIIQFGKIKSLADANESQKLIKLLEDFNGMYRPHESREDTVLFPAIRKIVSKNEYFALGEDFEHKEHELFGEDGFDTMVERVATIEKQLGIYDLSQFTPKL
ncbi:MAG TPA: hemerythrin [Prolixibacteraceae bacterium]|nr:hemerythrin [Prolixibacteraceae bacterium]